VLASIAGCGAVALDSTTAQAQIFCPTTVNGGAQQGIRLDNGTCTNVGNVNPLSLLQNSRRARGARRFEPVAGARDRLNTVICIVPAVFRRFLAHFSRVVANSIDLAGGANGAPDEITSPTA
jgi:hypothetical protein